MKQFSSALLGYLVWVGNEAGVLLVVSLVIVVNLDLQYRRK